eukprot:7715643-Pyramimonas_sp.AAC.1
MNYSVEKGLMNYSVEKGLMKGFMDSLSPIITAHPVAVLLDDHQVVHLRLRRQQRLAHLMC